MNSPKWISHRGLAVEAEENTLEAFQAAVEHGYKALETDLRLTKDNHIVLVHDMNLKRLAGMDKNLADLTRGELESLRYPRGGQCLFLDRFLDDFSQCEITMDIKKEGGEETLLRLGEMIEERKAAGWIAENWIAENVKFLTWSGRHEWLVKKMFPRARVYAKVGECRRAALCLMAGLPGLAGIQAGKTYALVHSFAGVSLGNKKHVAEIQKRHAGTVAFLPQTEGEIETAVQAGFDEILLDGEIPGGMRNPVKTSPSTPSRPA